MQESSSFFYYLLFSLNYIDWNSTIFLIFLGFYLKSKLTNIFILIMLYINNSTALSYFMCVNWPDSLLYGYNLIHPLLLYFSVYLFFLKILYQTKSKPKTLVFFLYLSLIAMILGMYWGSTNSSWGFFWTNDRIELILFFLICLFTYKIHKISFVSQVWLISYLFSILILYVLILRSGVVFTVHSFFINSTVSSIWVLNLATLLNMYIFGAYRVSLYYFLALPIIINYLRLFTALKIKNFKHVNIFILHLIVIFLVLSLLLLSSYYTVTSLSTVKTIKLSYLTLDCLSSEFLWALDYDSGIKHHITLILDFSSFNSVILFSALKNNYYLFIGCFYYTMYFILTSGLKTYIK